MKIKSTVVLIITLCTSFLTQAQTYKIDSGHSNVQIQVERFGVIDVIGRFKDVSGTMSYDGNSISNADAVIKVDSYDANNAGGEDAVKSPAFLDVASYPEITFTGTKTVTKENQNYLIGKLTIHGITQEIELPFTVKGPLMDLPTKKQSIAFLASTVINRQDYGITFNRKLPNGTLLIGNDVKITLTILALAE